MREARSVRRARRQRRVRPELRNGLNASPLRLPAGDWVTMADWAGEYFGASGVAALARGDFFANYQVPLTPDTPYQPGQQIWVFRPVPDEPDVPIELPVVAQWDGVIVVDKPHGLATIPRGAHVAQTVTVAARRQFQNDHIVPAHRLDAATAGLLLLVTDPKLRGAYQIQFQKRKVRRTYFAISALPAGAMPAWGEPRTVELYQERSPGELQWAVRPGVAPNSKTLVTAVQPITLTTPQHESELGSESAPGEPQLGVLWKLQPITGRTHQLRVALNHLGYPILWDRIYPQVQPELHLAHQPLQLLAAQLEFTDPITGAEMCISSQRHLSAWNNGDLWAQTANL